MVLTKAELIGALQHEVHILLHLTGKVDPVMRDYRPTPKQRSTVELLQYLTIMGPELMKAVKAGEFDGAAWGAAEARAKTLSFDQAVAGLATLGDTYASELSAMSDADLRGEIEMFGSTQSRGSLLVAFVLAGHAAYRTQLFLYLKSCGREELGTMNLWAGEDAPAPV